MLNKLIKLADDFDKADQVDIADKIDGIIMGNKEQKFDVNASEVLNILVILIFFVY